MTNIFIAGTDTEVGATVATRAIMQALQQVNLTVVGCKPVACSDASNSPYADTPSHSNQQQIDNIDLMVLQRTNDYSVDCQALNSYLYPHNIEPALNHLGNPKLQRIELQKLSEKIHLLEKSFQVVLVEGTHGWLTPLNEMDNYADWVAKEQMPTILVVGIKSGCINHALLTVQAIEQKGISLLGWVANRVNPGLSHYSETIHLLKEKINAPMIAEIPYMHRPEEKELAQYVVNCDYLLNYCRA